MKLPMPKNLKHVRALMGGVGYYRKFLPDLSKLIRPLVVFLRKEVKYDFTPAMEVIVRQILAELAAPPILVFRDWDAAADGSRRFTCTATPVSTVLVPRSGPLLISAALPSIPRGTGPRWTWKLVALPGPSNDYEVMYETRS